MAVRGPKMAVVLGECSCEYLLGPGNTARQGKERETAALHSLFGQLTSGKISLLTIYEVFHLCVILKCRKYDNINSRKCQS